MTAHLGSISTGTLRTEDLLSAFESELSWHLAHSEPTGAMAADWREAFEKLIVEANAWLETAEDEVGDDLVDDLIDALQAFAPPYCYFGTHWGDGANFGFWPSHDWIDELPVVEDSDEAKALGEDCRYVNDHGNVTVFGGDGSVLLDLV